MANPLLQLFQNVSVPENQIRDVSQIQVPNKTPVVSNAQKPTATGIPTGADPEAIALAKAIRQVESGNNPQAQGGSGEGGGYQFMPDTWKAWAGKYLGDPNAELSNSNQNKVAYSRIKELKDSGMPAYQIAASWNAGEGAARSGEWKNRIGVNKYGQKYNTPEYVKNVGNAYNAVKAEMAQNTGSYNTPGAIPGSQTAQGEPEKEGLLASMGKGLVSSLVKPFTIGAAGVYQGITGKDVNLPWYAGDVHLSSDPAQNARQVGAAALDTAALLPIGKAIKTAGGMLKGASPIVQGIAKESLSNAVTGALYGASGAMEQPESNANSIALGGILGGTTGAALGAAIPAGGAVLGAAIKPLAGTAEKTGGKLLRSVISTGMKDYQFGKQPLEQLAKEGITGSLEQMAEKTSTRLGEVGKAIGAQIDAAPANLKIPTSGILDDVDRAILEAKKLPEINATVISKLEAIKRDVGAQIKGKSYITAREAFNIKSVIGEAAKWTSADDKATNIALRQVYGKLKGSLNEAIPSLSSLNERYANLITAENAIQKTIQKEAAGTARIGGVLGQLGRNPVATVATLGLNKLAGQLENPQVVSRIASFISRASREELASELKAAPQFAAQFIKAAPRLKATGDASLQQNVDTVLNAIQEAQNIAEVGVAQRAETGKGMLKLTGEISGANKAPKIEKLKMSKKK